MCSVGVLALRHSVVLLAIQYSAILFSALMPSNWRTVTNEILLLNLLPLCTIPYQDNQAYFALVEEAASINLTLLWAVQSCA